jgi:hypothetical protein
MRSDDRLRVESFAVAFQVFPRVFAPFVLCVKFLFGNLNAKGRRRGDAKIDQNDGMVTLLPKKVGRQSAKEVGVGELRRRNTLPPD